MAENHGNVAIEHEAVIIRVYKLIISIINIAYDILRENPLDFACKIFLFIACIAIIISVLTSKGEIDSHNPFFADNSQRKSSQNSKKQSNKTGRKKKAN